MKIDERGVVESKSTNYSGLEYVDLSREFIKILDGKMDLTSEYMLYVCI